MELFIVRNETDARMKGKIAGIKKEKRLGFSFLDNDFG
jgi:hypothetical protein